MILVDSSVWIDYFRGADTAQTDKLDDLLGQQPLATGDIILTEVLRGFALERDFDDALRLLASLVVIEIGSQAIAIQAARNDRLLRARGLTINKTVDTLIATRCIEDGHDLLHCDRDFDAFVIHLGLRSVV